MHYADRENNFFFRPLVENVTKPNPRESPFGCLHTVQKYIYIYTYIYIQTYRHTDIHTYERTYIHI